MLASIVLVTLIVAVTLILGWANSKNPSKPLTADELKDYLADQDDRAI